MPQSFMRLNISKLCQNIMVINFNSNKILLLNLFDLETYAEAVEKEKHREKFSNTDSEFA